MMRWLTVIWLLLACAACSVAPSGDATPPLAMRTDPGMFIVVTVRNDQVPLSSRAGSTLRGYESAGTYSAGAFARSAVQSLARTYGLNEVSAWPISELGIHCVVFELPAGETPAAMLARLHHDHRVESAQPLNSFATRASTYNDPYGQLQTNLDSMGVVAAHRWSRGAGVNIAIVDTGADTQHPDLAGRVVDQQNFVDADAASFQRDRHGTAIAGVIAADSDNRIGIVGIAPEARLHVYKSCWQIDSTGASCNTFTLAKGLAAAITSRVHIVNLSLAGPTDPLLTRLVVRGQERGIVFVGAATPAVAGSTDDNAFPTGIAGVLKVAASESGDAGDALRAPGTDVLTLAPDGRYDFVSGNSLATASVTATVALLLSLDRKIDAERLEQLLSEPARAAASRGVNACAALARLTNGSCASAPE
jgi:Subtilase family